MSSAAASGRLRAQPVYRQFAVAFNESLAEADAYRAIRERVLRLNAKADEKRIHKFVYGK